jgi:3-dehydroquinate synthase
MYRLFYFTSLIQNRLTVCFEPKLPDTIPDWYFHRMKNSLIQCSSIPVLCRHLKKRLKGRAAFLLTDENVSRHWLGELLPQIDTQGSLDVIEVEPGEHSKSAEIALHIIDQLMECGAGRDALIINLGGGMITDLGGFIASIYKRGIEYINVPTSLLGMIDASSGGKTGINHSDVKNVIGTFYPAKEILLCSDFLRTLPETEKNSGFGEMLKHGYLSGSRLWKKMIGLDTSALPDNALIAECIAVKNKIVRSDPFEQGARKLLNLGHTFGHAYESYFLKNGRPLSHGQCVALGMITEALVARQKKLASKDNTEAFVHGILRFFPAGQTELPPFDDIVPFLLQDKKNIKGKLRMTLPLAPGNVLFDVEVSLAVAANAHSAACAISG